MDRAAPLPDAEVPAVSAGAGRASPPFRRGRWVLGGICMCAAVAVGILAWWWQHDPFPLTPIANSPFLNTRLDVAYVGSEACIGCHAEEHISFGRTGMGRSMALVDAKHSPPDGAVEHLPSKRHYRAFRKNGELWHQELLLTPDHSDMVLAEFPLKYVVGSGNHGLTYLVETDGFLVESPLTWYASRKEWDVSPGYDDPKQRGFARPIGEGCLFCHAGRAEVIGRSTHRTHVTETVIGCERCHGPGALHVERRTEGQSVEGVIDYTIVNPAHLSRDLAEAVCQQCHLNSDAAVAFRGRKLSDFRPGLRFADFQGIYVFKDSEQSMTVVGHVEQMHLSRCYQESETFSCLTCHNPHAEPAKAERAAHTNKVCLNCHRVESCTVSDAHRKMESPDNNCVHCHMPRSPTDIPHLAFTHHRVGIHRHPPTAPPAVDAKDTPGELQPLLPLPALSELDKQLTLGEAYRLLPLRSKHGTHKAVYQQRALGLLTGVHEAGLRNADLEASLAQLCFDMKVGEPLEYAERALGFPDLAGQGRCDALFVKAQILAERGNHTEAIAALRELTQLRRYVFDWLFLANYTRAIGEETAALDALKMAIRINPRQWDVHRYLARYYREQGNAEQAAWHEKRAIP